MVTWEGLGFAKGMILKIMIICLAFYLVTILIFKYLIKANKIKTSKISRMFYVDDESFVIKWEKDRKKSKFKYVVYNTITMSITIWVTSLIVIVVTDGDFNKLKNTLPVFWGFLIGNLFGFPLRWNKNEEKYDKLTNSIN